MNWEQIYLNLWQLELDFLTIQCHELDSYGFVLSVIEPKENGSFNTILTPTEIIDLCHINNKKYTMKFLGETLTIGEWVKNYILTPNN